MTADEHDAPMLEQLAQLHQLRGELEQSLAKLKQESVANPKSIAAVLYERVQLECRLIDEQIQHLSDAMLQREIPKGQA
jgi:hypothetical protein